MILGAWLPISGRQTRGPQRVCCASPSTSPTHRMMCCLLAAVSVCVLECCLGASVLRLAWSWRSVCCQPSRTYNHVCPVGGPGPGQGSLLPLPFNPSSASHEAHCACPSHVPVGRRTLLPRLERVYMMCSMHSPCPPACPAKDKMVAPRLPSTPCPLCSRVRWRVFPCRWRVT